MEAGFQDLVREETVAVEMEVLAAGAEVETAAGECSHGPCQPCTRVTM